MRAKRTLPRALLLVAAALIVVILAVAVERAMRPAPVDPAEDRVVGPDLSRAMNFTPPAEPKR